MMRISALLWFLILVGAADNVLSKGCNTRKHSYGYGSRHPENNGQHHRPGSPGYDSRTHHKKHNRTPLDDYIERPEPEFKWEVLGEYPGDGYTAYTLNMTSQVWMDESVTNNSVWWHYLIVNIPDDVVYTDSAFMLIANGSNQDPVPTPEINGFRLDLVNTYARGMGVPSAMLLMVPNQNVEVKGDPEGRWRRSDSFIAWTWRQYIDNDPMDPNIILYIPMTKAAVAAMTAITEFVNSKRPDLDPHKFFLTGESKRAWAAYLAAAVDDRVFAIAPMVLSTLNFFEVIHHQFRAYGGWSVFNVDYWLERIMADIDNPRFEEIMNISNPFAYMDRLTIPKLIIGATNDQAMLPDDTWYFWDQFPKDNNYFWMLENSGHFVMNSEWSEEIPQNVIAFFHAVRGGYRLPKMSWKRGEDEDIGWINLTTDTEPESVSMVWGKSASTVRRDFRAQEFVNGQLVPQDLTWYEEKVNQVHPKSWHYYGNNQHARFMYRATMDKPDDGDGWICFYIKVTYAGPAGRSLYFTTETNIIPDTFPFEGCSTPQECHGRLL